MTCVSSLLIAALIAVESKGDDYAVGDKGASHGCLQIQQCILDDVYELGGGRFYFHDCYDRDTAVWICRFYFTHYATVKKLGHSPQLKDLALIWHCGPDGWKRPDKDDYWPKVRKEMQNISKQQPQ